MIPSHFYSILHRALSFFSIGLITILLASCSHDEGKRVVIETSMGDIVVRLYDDTPLHRDNFLKLASEGVYDSIVFNRIVPEGTIQSGDPTLRAHGASERVGMSQLDYTLPAEILFPRYYHKTGALAMARQPDDINPKRRSSGTQFYIVTGKRYDAGKLADLREAIMQERITRMVAASEKSQAERLSYLKEHDPESWTALRDSILICAENYVAANPPVSYSDAQKKTYMQKGGAPHLDGDYTIFGEVIEGMNVVEAIGRCPVDGERPMKEIVIWRVRPLD